MEKNSRIFVAGHKGLVGSALVRRLKLEGYTNILTADRQMVDLRNQSAVWEFFYKNRPDYVFMAAAKVGGILANSTQQGDFIYENLMIETNVIGSAFRGGVKKLLFFGSSCIYPKFSDQPIQETTLLTDSLEPTNEAYAVAKIAGVKLCQYLSEQYGVDYYSIMPTNLYGPGDNFDLYTSHVLPALMRKFHEAKVRGESFVEVWGSGKPLREFMHVDDLADASVFLMHHHGIHDVGHLINVGTGREISILKLAHLLKRIIGYDGEICWDSSKPDGTPRKLMDSTKLKKLGWQPDISLEEGLKDTYKWALERHIF